jgi:invasion protein IalB
MENDATVVTGAGRSLGRAAFISLLVLNVVLVAGVLALLYERYALGTPDGRESSQAVAQPASPPSSEEAGAAAATGTTDQLGAPTNALKMTDSRAIGDWLYRCWEFPGDVGVKCSAVQQVIEESSKAALLRWTIGQDEKGGLVGEWLTPTNVFVNRGITLADVTEKPLMLPFASCSAGFCRAVANLAPDFVQTLGKAEKVSITYYRLEGGPLAVSPSPKGLSSVLALMAPAP